MVFNYEKLSSINTKSRFHRLLQNSVFFYLNSEKVFELDCPISELPKRDDIYDALFARINSFESSFAYLIINFTKANDTAVPSFVTITEMKHIFPTRPRG